MDQAALLGVADLCKPQQLPQQANALAEAHTTATVLS
jgi:hypothetical protein